MNRALVLSFCLLTTGCVGTHPGLGTHPNLQGPQKDMTRMPRVVFVGDLQTYAWITAVQANQPLWINAATNTEETTASMLARFQTDVIDQHPDVVHFLAGHGDSYTDNGAVFLPCAGGGSSPSVCINLVSNLLQMIAMAHNAGIYVILGTIPDQPGTGTEDPFVADGVFYFNTYLLERQKDFGIQGLFLVDALVNYSALVPAGWTDDGYTPNQVGLNAFTNAAVAAIEACQCGGTK